MPRVHTVKKARKDYPASGIRRGDTYYHWKFRYGGLRRSKTYPKPQQLTQSEFMITMYDIQETIANLVAESAEDLATQRDDIAGEIQSLLDETQERLDNMPEHLQESSASGELLTKRIEALENWISELEDIETEIDMEGYDKEENGDKEEWLSEQLNEKICEIQGTESGL